MPSLLAVVAWARLQILSLTRVRQKPRFQKLKAWIVRVGDVKTFNNFVAGLDPLRHISTSIPDVPDCHQLARSCHSLGTLAISDLGKDG
jgi:hypothetical protein